MPVEWEGAVVKNLSMGGCYFRSSRPHLEGRELEMYMQLPASRGALPVKGVVRHCRILQEGEEFYFLGVSFELLRPQVQNQFKCAIDFFLNKKKAHSRA